VAETNGHCCIEEIERLNKWQPPSSFCFTWELALYLTMSSSPQIANCQKGDPV